MCGFLGRCGAGSMRWRNGFVFAGSWCDVVPGRCAGATVPTWCRRGADVVPTWCRRGVDVVWCRVDAVPGRCGAGSTWCRRGVVWCRRGVVPGRCGAGSMWCRVVMAWYVSSGVGFFGSTWRGYLWALWCRCGVDVVWALWCRCGVDVVWALWCRRGVGAVVSTWCRRGVDVVWALWCRCGAKWYTLFLWGRFFGVLSGAQNVPQNGRDPAGAKCGRFAMIYFYSAQKFARVISAGGPAVPGCFFLASMRGCGGSFFVLFSIKKRASFQLARFVVCIIFLGRRLYLA